MSSPDAPREEPEPESEEELARAGRRLSWKMFFHLMISPMAFLAPCFSCGAAITFSHSFGPAGGIVGALLGFLIGVGCIFLWYFVIIGKPLGAREEDFAEKMIADAEAGRLGRGLGRPGVQPSEIEAIPLSAGPALAVDIEGDVASAIARIDLHPEPSEALAAAEGLRKKHGRDARAVGCLARVLLRLGRPKEGVRMAGEALHVAVLTAQMGVVPRLVHAFWDHREALALDPSVAAAVADHLDQEGQPNRAAFFRSGRTSLV